MNILFAVWELDPFFKVGGLGDVARSLPSALVGLGADIRVIIPYYRVLKLGRQKKKKVGEVWLEYAHKKEIAKIYEVRHPASLAPVYLVQHKKYLGIAKFPDTYAFFSLVIVKAVKENIFNWHPQIIHCNDLHTSLVPLLLKEDKLPVKTMLTIHNLSYQGKTAMELVTRLGLDESRCKIIHWEIKSKKINLLMEGIVHADVITTVSPTYAKEILTEEYGSGLEEILRGKEGRIFGILNGIDMDWKFMMHNKAIRYPYMISRNNIPRENAGKIYSFHEGKRLNKLFLQKKLKLKVDASLPLISFIGRFDPNQKGIDILHKMLRRLDLEKYQFVILGTGDIYWQERYEWLGKFYPRQVSCNFLFNEELASQIYAASDFILIPSRFEPCGLIQMVAMYYGTIPIAHTTGGLIDSIKDGVNGFLFNKYSSELLEKCLKRAVAMLKKDKTRFNTIVNEAMSTDFSWKVSAKKYLDLYQKLLNNEY